MHGFPAAHCRVLALAAEGDDAFVVLDTGPAEYRCLYGGTVQREGGGWRPGTDSNGGGVGWTRTDARRALGVVALWDEAPTGADAVRIRWDAVECEIPVRNGVYLAAWWRVPCPEDAYPRVTAYRVGGEWRAAG